MGCESCTKGSNGTPAGCKNNGTCSSGGCSKLAVYDWLSNMELPGNVSPFEYVEIRFKNSRKDFFSNFSKLNLNPGDCVVVEGSPGYDVGIVSASGELARLQMEKKKTRNLRELKKVLRFASKEEMEVWREARSLEEEAMYKARGIAYGLGLEMKISDVEYQGDKTKATFYYTAEGRVDFRELIKKYAETFRVRIEMKQIGARQEASRLGGIGSCGRELCCSTWLTDFRSVSTSAARYQQLALNTQKLAGQCGKLKCCLNYELDAYMDALKKFPKNAAKLKTKKGHATHIKTDIFKELLWYIYEEGKGASPIAIPVERVRTILEMNEDGKLPEDLKDFALTEEPIDEAYSNVVGQDSLTRFDKKGRPKKRKGGKKSRGPKPQASSQKSQNPPQKSQGDGPKNTSPKRRKNSRRKGKGGGNKNNPQQSN